MVTGLSLRESIMQLKGSDISIECNPWCSKCHGDAIIHNSEYGNHVCENADVWVPDKVKFSKKPDNGMEFVVDQEGEVYMFCMWDGQRMKEGSVTWGLVE